jgi:hypothetical protein
MEGCFSFELTDDIIYNGLIPGDERQGGLVFQGVGEIELLEAGMHSLAPQSKRLDFISEFPVDSLSGGGLHAAKFSLSGHHQMTKP